jgi:GT2 family glycosyltransferase
MVRSASFFEAGGFDGSFFAHMEEIDLCWRLQTLGGEGYAVPQSVVYHVGGATLSKDNPRKTYLNFRNNLIMLYKNLPDDELRAVMLVRTVLDYVAALKFLFTGAWGSFRAVLRARCHYRRLRGGYEAARRDNIVSTVGTVWGRLPFSLLWQYYVRGRKTYTRLKM